MCKDQEQACDSRERHWSERSPSEKVEVLRHEVIHLARICHTLSQEAEQMRTHEHLETGRIVVPYEMRPHLRPPKLHRLED